MKSTAPTTEPPKAGDTVIVFGSRYYGVRGRVLRISGAEAVVVIETITLLVPLCDLEVVP